MVLIKVSLFQVVGTTSWHLPGTLNSRNTGYHPQQNIPSCLELLFLAGESSCTLRIRVHPYFVEWWLRRQMIISQKNGLINKEEKNSVEKDP